MSVEKASFQIKCEFRRNSHHCSRSTLFDNNKYLHGVWAEREASSTHTKKDANPILWISLTIILHPYINLICLNPKTLVIDICCLMTHSLSTLYGEVYSRKDIAVQMIFTSLISSWFRKKQSATNSLVMTTLNDCSPLRWLFSSSWRENFKSNLGACSALFYFYFSPQGTRANRVRIAVHKGLASVFLSIKSIFKKLEFFSPSSFWSLFILILFLQGHYQLQNELTHPELKHHKIWPLHHLHTAFAKIITWLMIENVPLLLCLMRLFDFYFYSFFNIYI